MSRIQYRTPGVSPFWWNLDEWVETARILDCYRARRQKNQQCVIHARALSLKIVWDERSLDTLQTALDLLTDGSGFRQPPRGQRADAPHTLLISAIKNRMKKLERDLDRESIPDGHNSLSMRPSLMAGLFNG